MNVSEIVTKVWNYAHVLRDDGVGYGDYVEQITYLIFLKMTHEREQGVQKGKVPGNGSFATTQPPNKAIHGQKYAWVKLDGEFLWGLV